MPLVEFMMHATTDGNPHGRQIPGFIRGSADFFNPADNTYVGWVADNRDFYLPDTITILTKETFVQRMLTMHTATPFRRPALQQGQMDPQTGTFVANPEGIPEGEVLTTEQVVALAEAKYDFIVNHCKTEEGSL